MGVFSSFGKFMLMPVLRPLKQTKESYGQLSADIANLKALRLAREQQALVDKEEFLRANSEGQLVEGQLVSAKEMADPTRIKNPFIRFEVLYQMHGWTEESLLQQQKTCRRTKIAGAYMCIALLLMAIASLFYLPVLAMILSSSMLLLASSVSLASSVKYAIYQAQIEQRKLLGARDILSRADLLPYLFMG